MTDLEALGGYDSQAFAINNTGIVTGKFTHTTGDHAFVTDAQWHMKDFTSLLIIDDGSTWNLRQANGINNFGKITGEGIHNFIVGGNRKSVRRAFILTPEEIAPANIPADKSHGDSIKLGESQKDTIQCDKAKNCSQLTTGSYSLTLKLSANTLENNRIDIGKLNSFTPFTINIGSYAFSGTLNSADPDKKAKTPSALPATWTDSHSVCTPYVKGQGCSGKFKTVVDSSVKISSDLKQTTKTVTGSASGPFMLNNISIKAELTSAP